MSEITNPKSQITNLRTLTAQECTGFVAGFLNAFAPFAKIETIRDAALTNKERFEKRTLNYAECGFEDSDGDMPVKKVDWLLSALCVALNHVAQFDAISEALRICFDPTNPAARLLWQMAEQTHKIARGEICVLCGQPDHKSENCPRMKGARSIHLPGGKDCFRNLTTEN